MSTKRDKEGNDRFTDLTREAAIEELAKYLHWKQWHLDPPLGEDAPPEWADLLEFDQNFYRSSVDSLLCNLNLIKTVVCQERLPNHFYVVLDGRMLVAAGEPPPDSEYTVDLYRNLDDLQAGRVMELGVRLRRDR